MQYEITDIQYDEGHSDLPSSLIMTTPNQLSPDELEEQASDFISEKTGFCHKGFNVSALTNSKESVKMDHLAINRAFESLTGNGMHIRTPMQECTGDLGWVDSGEIAENYNIPKTDINVEIIFNVKAEGKEHFVDIIAHGKHGTTEIAANKAALDKQVTALTPKVIGALKEQGVDVAFEPSFCYG